MSRTALLYGNQSLLDEYNHHVAEKLSAKSSAITARVVKLSEQSLVANGGAEKERK